MSTESIRAAAGVVRLLALGRGGRWFARNAAFDAPRRGLLDWHEQAARRELDTQLVRWPIGA